MTDAAPTPEEIDAARALVAREDARLADEAETAQRARRAAREQGMADLRKVLATKAYTDLRDRILALEPQFEGDPMWGYYTGMFANLEEWAA